MPIADGASAPHISITDFARKIVYARIGNTLRVAGMADLVRARTPSSTARGSPRWPTTRALFGDIAPRMEPGQLHHGPACARLRRAAAADGGASRLRGLWLDIGHGALRLHAGHGQRGLAGGWLRQDAGRSSKPGISQGRWPEP
ncbi:hypothetical protein ACU4GD_29395 [Cupriavidus basilensis]